MKSILPVIAFLGSMVLATPLLDKRYMVTSVVMETVTVTETETRNWWNWNQPTDTPTATNTISIVSSTSSLASVSPTSTDSAISSSTSSATATTDTSASSQPTASLSAYAEPILRQHNLHRANHSAPDLVWDDGLANIAQEIASSCQYAHNLQVGGGGYGQNIGAGARDDEVEKMITNQMYNYEIEYYPGYTSEPDMSNFERWGHFSQIVWKSTSGVGCYTQHCTGGLSGVGSNVEPYFTVCNYREPGNVAGAYVANVGAPLNEDPIFL